MLRVHFLNVGHGDCTIIKHPSGRLTMIDINNSQQFDSETFLEELREERRKIELHAHSARSLANVGVAGDFGSGLGNIGAGSNLFAAFGIAPAQTLLGGLGSVGILGSNVGFAEVEARAKQELTDPIAWLMKNYPRERVWRYIQSHPDLDHMRGLKRLAENIGFDNFWDTQHTKETPTFRSGTADKDDWDFYQDLRARKVSRYFTRGDAHFAYAKDENGMPGGDGIEILSPDAAVLGAANTAKNSNDVSVVLRVNHAGRSVMLPGDVEELAWDHMVQNYGARLKSDFLKASHHGRDSGYHQKALSLISPILTVISVGLKPDTDASNKYRQQTGHRVPSTRYHGNIELRIADDGSWQWFVERNPG